MSRTICSTLPSLTLLLVVPPAIEAAPMSSVFAFQGQLKKNGVPLNGDADMTFTLWNALEGGISVAGPIPIDSIAVEGGLFTVELDFGADAFRGDAVWLEITVRSPAGVGDFTILTPRRPLTATPYALHARGVVVDENFNVGIGTSTPAAKLDVRAGDIHMDANREVFFSDNGQVRSRDDNHRILFRRDENKLELREYGDIVLSAGATAGNETGSVIVDSSGRVGIGTTAPEATLDINGEMIHRGGALKHLGHDLIIADATRGDGGRALVHEGDGTNERLVLNFANDFNQGTVVHGNLGIGRTPGTRLDVADGDIRVDMDRRLKFDAEDGRFLELGYDSTTDSGVMTAAGRNLELNTGWGESLTLRAGHGGIKFNIQTDAGNDATKMELTSAGDLQVQGDVIVSGALRGDIGPNSGSPFPRPAYDSGWIALEPLGTQDLVHNVGGNVDNYVVDLQMRDLNSAYPGITNHAIGGDYDVRPDLFNVYGYYWYGLTSTHIRVYRNVDDTSEEFRVRIWVYK